MDKPNKKTKTKKTQKKSQKTHNPRLPPPPDVHNSTVLVDQPRSDYNRFLYVRTCTLNPVIFAVI